MQGIYWYRNKINDKRYIGSAQNFKDRWQCHEWMLKNNRHFNSYLQNAWDKYGEANFVWEIVEEVEGAQEIVLSCEQKYLDEWFPTGLLYNIAEDATASMAGKHHTEKTRQKMSKAQAGKTWMLSQEIRDEMSRRMMGHKVTQETCDNISKAKMGHEVTQETRGKISIALSGENGPWFGKHHTEESKAKMREIALGNEHPARPYPAFFNEETGDFIPAGKNLAGMCRKLDLSYGRMSDLRRKHTRRTHGGWRLATPEEVQRLN